MPFSIHTLSSVQAACRCAHLPEEVIALVPIQAHTHTNLALRVAILGEEGGRVARDPRHKSTEQEAKQDGAVNSLHQEHCHHNPAEQTAHPGKLGFGEHAASNRQQAGCSRMR